MIKDMHARRNAAPPWAASSIQLIGLACAWLPLPVRAAVPAAQGSWLAAVLTLSMALVAASFWYWKRRAEQALRCGELRLDEARRELRACEEGAREASQRAELALQAAQGEQERLAQALFDSEQRLELHLSCASELVFVLDLEGRLQQLSSNWREALGVDTAQLVGQHHGWLLHPDDLPHCQGAIERALSSRSPQDEVEYRIRHAEGDWRWHAARIAPLSDSKGRVLGLLGVARTLSEGLRPGRQTLRKVCFDPLTGLPGRGLCLDRLQQALRQAERHANRAALLLIELDDFRLLNERRGHATGDLVLLESASRIAACVRSSDTIGRSRGATFMVLLPDIGAEREAIQVARKIRRALSAPLQLRQRTLVLTASMGIAVYPSHGDDEDELAAQAARALRLARQSGRGQIALPGALAMPAEPLEVVAA